MATSQNAPQDISLTTAPVNRLDNPTDREQSTIRHGQHAWHQLRQAHSWEDWKQVGAAVVIGRRGAMREAAVNRPVVSAVLRKWKSASAIAPIPNSRLSPIKQCRQENSALQQEILRLRRDREHVAGDHWQPADRPEDVATALLAILGRDKAAAVAGAILEALEEKVAD